MRPRKLIKKFTPDVTKFRRRWYLRPFEAALRDPAIWHVNRRSTARAFAMGLFIASIPLPVQMPLASLGAIYFRVNLPVSIASVWVTNPLTIGPMFYFAYEVGAWLIGVAPHPFPNELSFGWLFDALAVIWKPLSLGCLITGITAAAVGYFGINLLWLVSIRRRQARRHRYWQTHKTAEDNADYPSR